MIHDGARHGNAGVRERRAVHDCAAPAKAGAAHGHSRDDQSAAMKNAISAATAAGMP